MRWWSLHPKRSARRRANAELRALRTVRGTEWLRMCIRAWFFRAGWRPPVVVALVLSFPLVLFLGHKVPSWVSDAWVVSGVPIALILSLLVFLLATAGGQNLRAAAPYQAIVSRTFLAWPVALSVVFLVWCGVIERFGNDTGSAPSAFVETWLLVLFAAVVVGVLVVFVQLLSLVAPAQVMELVEFTFAEDVRRSIAERLRRKFALVALEKACVDAGIKLGLFGGGRRVWAGRIGWIHDIDLRLPATVEGFHATAETRLSMQLGDRATPDVAIALLDGDVGDWLPRLLRQGVSVRRRAPVRNAPGEIFDELLDLARRSVNEGIPSAVESSFDLIGRCMRALPSAYRIFGIEYTGAATSEGLLPSPEQNISRAISRFARDVVVSANQEAQRQLPNVALTMALGGVSDDAPLLLQQGLDLWAEELVVAEALEADEAYRAYVADIPMLARHVAQRLQSRIQDDSLTVDRRRSALPLLRQVFRFQTVLLKMQVDRGDVGAFRNTWEESVAWARHWRPEDDIDDLELAFGVAPEPRRRSAGHELDLARELVAVKAELVEERAWNTLNLGVWMLLRYQFDELERAAWEQLLPFVTGPFESLDALAAAAGRLGDGDGRMALIHDWDLNAQLARVRPGTGVGSRVHPAETLWVALLMMRLTPSDRVPHLVLGDRGADGLGSALLTAIGIIEGDTERWDVVVNGQVTAKAANLRTAVQSAIAAARAAAAAEAAGEPISEERVAHFVAQQQRAFMLANRIRELVVRAGALDIEVSESAFADVGLGIVVDKRFFVEDGLAPPPLDWNQPGRDLAADEQGSVYEKLAQTARPAPHAMDPVSSIVAGLDELRADGFEPDAVLVPVGGAALTVLLGHPLFKPTPRLREHPAELGELAGVAVLAVGPNDALSIVAGQVGRAIRLKERRRPGMTSSLFCDVRAISAERGREFLVASEVGDVEATDANIARLRDGAVELFTRLDFEVLTGDAGARASRIALLPLSPSTP
jgi:hypothetical protein